MRLGAARVLERVNVVRELRQRGIRGAPDFDVGERAGFVAVPRRRRFRALAILRRRGFRTRTLVLNSH